MPSSYSPQNLIVFRLSFTSTFDAWDQQNTKENIMPRGEEEGIQKDDPMAEQSTQGDAAIDVGLGQDANANNPA